MRRPWITRSRTVSYTHLDVYKRQAQNQDLVAANQAAADFDANMAQMAERLSPVSLAVQEGINRILQKVLELTEDADFEKVGDAIDSCLLYTSSEPVHDPEDLYLRRRAHAPLGGRGEQHGVPGDKGRVPGRPGAGKTGERIFSAGRIRVPDLI